MEIKGDLRVRRTMSADRRANEGLTAETITAARVVDVNDFAWVKLDGGAASRDVTLPDATLLTAGWKVVIQNDGSTSSLVVKDNAGTALKTIMAPAADNDTRAYQFVCTDTSTAAGVWYVIELGDATLVATKFVVNFLDTDFPAAVSGRKTLTKTQVAGLGAMTHGRGVNPVFQVQEVSGTDFIRVLCDKEVCASNGDISLVVTTSAEFTGRVVLV